jgi:hypothetical protein
MKGLQLSVEKLGLVAQKELGSCILHRARQITQPTKVLTEGGDLREAQVLIPLSDSHSCVKPDRQIPWPDQLPLQWGPGFLCHGVMLTNPYMQCLG